MKAYLETVQEKASENGIDLLEAFKIAEIPTSTYYRTINGETEMRFDTACKVLDAIDEQIKRDARVHIPNNYERMVKLLIDARRERGLSQENLSDKIGCTPTLVGKVGSIPKDALWFYADVLVGSIGIRY